MVVPPGTTLERSSSEAMLLREDGFVIPDGPQRGPIRNLEVKSVPYLRDSPMCNCTSEVRALYARPGMTGRLTN